VVAALVYGSGLPSRDIAMADQCKVLANLLDADSFMTVPTSSATVRGRVFLTAGKRPFVQDDVDFFAS